jgi:hypothetical protein
MAEERKKAKDVGFQAALFAGKECRFLGNIPGGGK